MNEDELRAIEERAAKATPGPWEVHPKSATTVVGPTGYSLAACSCDSDEQDRWPATASFIAHARSDVDHLVAEVRTEKARADSLRALLRDVLMSDADWVEGGHLPVGGEDVETVLDAIKARVSSRGEDGALLARLREAGVVE